MLQNAILLIIFVTRVHSVLGISFFRGMSSRKNSAVPLLQAHYSSASQPQGFRHSRVSAPGVLLFQTSCSYLRHSRQVVVHRNAMCSPPSQSEMCTEREHRCFRCSLSENHYSNVLKFFVSHQSRGLAGSTSGWCQALHSTQRRGFAGSTSG